jgi:hypothetical protein
VLAQIAINYPTRVAAIEMHIASSYPLYCPDALNRMYYYPPPYYSGGWEYVTPWLWYDGNKHGSYDYTYWQSMITTEMNVTARVTTTISGAYNPATRKMTVYAKFRNDTTATLTNARAMCVVTEDSLYYAGPNGDNWHNHVARKYLPTYNGQIVTIAAGDSVTVLDSLTLNAAWNASKCQVVVWLQNDVMKTDTTKPIYQGALKNITTLPTPVEEIVTGPVVSPEIVTLPNPCVNGTTFLISRLAGSSYRISIFDVSGRLVTTLKGMADKNSESVKWDCRDGSGAKVNPGVYLFRLESASYNKDGKIVVR